MASPRPWARLPAHAPGMRIGLLGGSFNPAHRGHRHIALLALTRLRLDAVWWLVTPGNPLKDHSDLAALQLRVENARQIAAHRRLKVTGFEAKANTAYTADTLDLLRFRCPGVHFVWLMGADNLCGFHRWDRWRRIARTMPIAVVDRPGATFKALASPAAHALATARLPDVLVPGLPLCQPPAWAFLFGPRSAESSTRLRRNGLPGTSKIY